MPQPLARILPMLSTRIASAALVFSASTQDDGGVRPAVALTRIVGAVKPITPERNVLPVVLIVTVTLSQLDATLTDGVPSDPSRLPPTPCASARATDWNALVCVW